jgi:hypothetical protein
MGRKGVSKRKPKKSGSNDNNNNHGSSNARPGESSSSVQSLVRSKDAPRDRGSTNPSAGSNKKRRK